MQALIAFNSMVADVVDEHELITGLRQEGIFFSSISFSNKMTSGIGTVAAGFALAFIDWPTGSDVQTAADIGAENHCMARLDLRPHRFRFCGGQRLLLLQIRT